MCDGGWQTATSLSRRGATASSPMEFPASYETSGTTDGAQSGSPQGRREVH